MVNNVKHSWTLKANAKSLNSTTRVVRWSGRVGLKTLKQCQYKYLHKTNGNNSVSSWAVFRSPSARVYDDMPHWYFLHIWAAAERGWLVLVLWLRQTTHRPLSLGPHPDVDTLIIRSQVSTSSSSLLSSPANMSVHMTVWKRRQKRNIVLINSYE